MNSKKEVVAAFFMGISALMFELLWNRYLALLLGSSTYAVGVVTACYMVGMGVGSFLLGNLADKNQRLTERIVFAGFFICCALSPIIYYGLQKFNIAVSGTGLLGRIIIVMLVLFIPTCLIGGILPLLTKERNCAKENGVIYAAYTLGSVCGALLAGFFTIRIWGLRRSFMLASGLVLVGSWMYYRMNDSKEKIGERSVEKVKSPLYIRRTILLIYTISGFTGMAYQMYVTRLLTLFFMDSVYDFAIILSVFLTGLFVGNYFFTKINRKKYNYVVLLSYIQIVLAFVTIGSLLWLQVLPQWTEGLRLGGAIYKKFGIMGWWYALSLKILYTGLIVFLPAILWGGTYPIVNEIFYNPEEKIATQMGVLIGCNTVGSAVGSILGTFFLISFLGLQNAVIFNGVLNFGTGMLLWCIIDIRKHGQAKIYVTVAMILSCYFLPDWNKFSNSTSFLVPQQVINDSDVEILFYKEDSYGITSVVEFLPIQQRFLTTNRLYCQNTTGMDGPQHHARLGVIPVMVHQNPENVLVTGVGAGVTLYGSTLPESVKNVDCVEISSAVIDALPYFSDINHNLHQNEKVSFIIEDARNYVATTSNKYDVIIEDIFFPMSAGASNLFSQEYYKDCKQILKPGGHMMQWIPMHQFSQEEFELVTNTFASVFPHTYLWIGMIGTSTPVVGLMGTLQELAIDYNNINIQYERDEVFKQCLYEMALDDENMLLSHYIGSVEYNEDDEVMVDDKPVLEYLNPQIDISYAGRGKLSMLNVIKGKESIEQFSWNMTEEERMVLRQYDKEIVEFIKTVYQFEK